MSEVEGDVVAQNAGGTGDLESTLIPKRAWRALAALAVAMLLSMATWFSASAVVPQLASQFQLSDSTSAWLTIGVQVGFVIGALVLATTSAADRFGPRHLMFAGTTLAGIMNLGMLAANDAWQIIALRILTGACLAAVYPSAMKCISTWFKTSRATAVGVMIGALTVGSASPHLVAAAGSLDWRFVVVGTSLLSAAGGLTALLAAKDGPFTFPRSKFSLREALRAFTARPVLMSSLGYFGHMWELYAMWSWFSVYLSSVLARSDSPLTEQFASLATFVVVSIGAVGCLVGGRLAERVGSAKSAIVSMIFSGACAAVIGWIPAGALWLVLLIALLWGFWVIADSAQFSVLITQVADQRYVGSMLTLQMALGYTVTVPIVWLVPTLQANAGWGWAFVCLALGPAIGVLAIRSVLRQLKHHGEGQ
ncbi:MFS transporter [Pseudarthrobacter sp. J1763]|uniref:MFS transporter n=1 Tax=Pseudarthrobacter sp. J1763 TaxID=3420445 RepID=UPI003D2B8CDF